MKTKPLSPEDLARAGLDPSLSTVAPRRPEAGFTPEQLRHLSFDELNAVEAENPGIIDAALRVTSEIEDQNDQRASALALAAQEARRERESFSGDAGDEQANRAALLETLRRRIASGSITAEQAAREMAALGVSMVAPDETEGGE